MPGKGTTHALFILMRTQEKFLGKEKKLYMCFRDLEETFDSAPRKVMEWALTKKRIGRSAGASSDEFRLI